MHGQQRIRLSCSGGLRSFRGHFETICCCKNVLPVESIQLTGIFQAYKGRLTLKTDLESRVFFSQGSCASVTKCCVFCSTWLNKHKILLPFLLYRVGATTGGHSDTFFMDVYPNLGCCSHLMTSMHYPGCA